MCNPSSFYASFVLWTASLLLVLLMVSPSQPAEGAGATGAVTSDSCSTENLERLSSGVEALESDDVDQALQALRPIVEGEPGCFSAEDGAAAYWLGEAFGRAEKTEKQLEVWETGLKKLNGPASPFDVRLANAFIDIVFYDMRGAYYARGVQAYLHLLNRIGKTDLQREHEILAQHLRLVSPLLPRQLKIELGISRQIDAETVGTLNADVGQRLVNWWDAQDPLPATFPNERVEEHLERVSQVVRLFEKEGRVDDRGMVYVRLGAPYRKTDVNFNSIRFSQGVFTSNMRFNSNDFRMGEFWVYDQISRATQYLFVETSRDVYEVGDVVDLLPNSLKRGFSSTQRGYQEAAAFVRAMTEAYRQLAIYHDRYHTQFQTFSNYQLDLEAGTTNSIVRGNRRARDFARQSLMSVKDADVYHEEQRELNTPTTFSTVGDPSLREIPVAVHTTRFLREDGRTRVELNWSIPFSGINPEARSDRSPAYMISGAVVKRDEGGKSLATRRFRSLLRANEDTDAFLTPQTEEVLAQPGTRFRLDSQWDQYQARSASRRARVGKIVGRYVYRSDTLRALSNDQTQLLLSDVRPMVLPAGTDEETAVETAIPYPFDRVTPATPLAFYFEVYHLSFGPEDRTRFSVDYRVQRRKGDRYESLFDGGEWTSVAATSETSSRTSREYVLIDLEAWEGTSAEDIRVTVRVTDEHSTQSVQRSVDLTLFPTGASGDN